MLRVCKPETIRNEELRTRRKQNKKLYSYQTVEISMDPHIEVKCGGQNKGTLEIESKRGTRKVGRIKCAWRYMLLRAVTEMYDERLL